MKDHAPRVSIGLPVYNGEKYLQQAIDSILAQTYSDFELIISDNASTDRTQDICRAYIVQDKRIQYYRNTENLGLAANYNNAYSRAVGEYFKWAAHDDLVAPAFMERCVDALDNNPAAVLAYSKAEIIDANGFHVVNHDPGPNLTSLGAHQRFRAFLFSSYLAVQLSGLIRSSVLRKTGKYGKYPASDEVLLAELALYGPFVEIPDRLFCVRLHNDQTTFGALVPGAKPKPFKQRDRALLFDTSLRDRVALLHWMYFFDCLRAANGAPVSLYQHVYCYVQMARWVLVPSHTRAMGKDVFLAARQVFRRSYLMAKNGFAGAR